MITEEEEYEVPESNWGRRAGAFFIDLVVYFILTYGLLLLFFPNYLIFIPYPLDNLLFFLIFWLFLGVISIVITGLLEGIVGASIGKGMMGLEVYSLDTESMTVGKGIGRSLSKIIFFIPLIDKAAGSGKGDPRQRASDIWQNTIVGDFIPIERPEPQPISTGLYVKPIEPKEEVDEFEDLPIPKELLSGRCPYCSTPYNIVPSKDKRTWSGLWGSRCIWCNKKVFEAYRSRVQPGQWV